MAYAVAQEALTNALKHAPDAPIEITVWTDPQRLIIEICNTEARSTGLGLAATGGGHGLSGLRERVLASGGTFAAGPTGDGGWQVTAELTSLGTDTDLG